MQHGPLPHRHTAFVVGQCHRTASYSSSAPQQSEHLRPLYTEKEMSNIYGTIHFMSAIG